MLQVENEMNDYNISGGSRGGAWEARPRRFILDKKLKKKELEKEEKPAGQSTKNRPSPPPLSSRSGSATEYVPKLVLISKKTETIPQSS